MTAGIQVLLSLQERNSTNEQPKLEVQVDGKFSTKATWETLGLFTGIENMTSDDLCEMVRIYELKAYGRGGEKKENDNEKPKMCWIRDENPPRSNPFLFDLSNNSIGNP